MRSFGADPSRFPKGLSHTVRLLKDEFGVKYVGVWQAFQSYWNGVDPNGEAIIGRHEGLDTAAVRHFGNALINCMGMVLENYWHRPVSPIVRSSDDYLPHNSRSLAEHVMQNAFNALLMGELYHCDWDMFWSEHPHAWAHGIMRLLSGGRCIAPMPKGIRMRGCCMIFLTSAADWRDRTHQASLRRIRCCAIHGSPRRPWASMRVSVIAT
ncbi:MAG: Sip1-related alpha-galactosidase [Bifidobacterium dentium]